MSGGLTELIEALTIFRKYGDPDYPTHCEHDEMTIVGIEPEDVSDEDKAQLERLGFFVGDEYFMSFKFGSA